MNVLSLLDGMSCGQIALERAGKRIDRSARKIYLESRGYRVK